MKKNVICSIRHCVKVPTTENVNKRDWNAQFNSAANSSHAYYISHVSAAIANVNYIYLHEDAMVEALVSMWMKR